MGSSSGFGLINEDRKNLSFFKIFQSADLSSENMRAFSYDFITSVPQMDLSDKMVITTEWGSSWKVGISKNPRFYYMDKRGWKQFVSDNALGANEFVTFTHTGGMCFIVNIFEQNGKELVKPRTMASSSRWIKKEQGEISNKNVDKEEEKAAPKFKMTIQRSYIKHLPVPRCFVKNHILKESKMFTIYHKDRTCSWNVLCVVATETMKTFSKGWSSLVREYPLMLSDICTFKAIKPTEFVLVVSKKAREEDDSMIVD